MASQPIGFLGSGQMARALAFGLVDAGLVAPGQVFASDPIAAAMAEFDRLVPGAQTAQSNRAVVDQSQVVFLAVKPQQVRIVLSEIKSHLTEQHLLVSIAAGVRLSTLAEWIEHRCRLVRVMPNTPCLVGVSASAYALGPKATEEDDALVKRLLSAVGYAAAVDEKLLDAVTGLSGSGPAFVYVLIEALADGGVRMGLPRELAAALAAQTVKGAAEMVLRTGEHPAVLKD
ncbi:MAG TPA: pyrroline-5-carboxylate reductase, partial [Pirellulales bacterium]|nr:pyrroline-5-carboxylate reductase [Pirellulales bacterium]